MIYFKIYLNMNINMIIKWMNIYEWLNLNDEWMNLYNWIWIMKYDLRIKMKLEWWKWLFYRIDECDCYLNLILIDNDWYLNRK